MQHHQHDGGTASTNGATSSTATRRLSHMDATISGGGQPASPVKGSTRPTLNGHASRGAIPGRTRRRTGAGRRRGSAKRRGGSFWRRCYSRWCRDLVSSFSSLFLAVLLWYSLGVISIGTSKLLLTGSSSATQPSPTSLSTEPKAAADEGAGEEDVKDYNNNLLGGVPPLFLTLQQLLIGSTLLRFLLKIRFLGSLGLQPTPSLHSFSSPRSPMLNHHPHGGPSSLPKRRIDSIISLVKDYPPDLLLSGIYFSLGFLATNFGFSATAASFVETIKAAEPITSATVAVWWGIEVLSRQEVASLGGIVAGVLLSTLGNRHHAATTTAADANSATAVADSVRSCLIVMASNLCFSFRGLHQKLFRITRGGNALQVDDLNLQFRMQQIGVCMLFVPVLIWNLPSMTWSIWTAVMSPQGGGIVRNGLLFRYLGLSLINGFAFTSYNLASTYILSRISVVHHAALNCIRRIFAIVVTSIIFEVPITILGALGVIVSFCSFLSFTHYKVQRQRTPKPVSSLLPVSVADHHNA